MHWQFPLHQQENNDKIFATKAIFNRLPGVGAATNKRRMAQVFRKMHEYYPSEFNFSPRTYILPSEWE